MLLPLLFLGCCQYNFLRLLVNASSANARALDRQHQGFADLLCAVRESPLGLPGFFQRPLRCETIFVHYSLLQRLVELFSANAGFANSFSESWTHKSATKLQLQARDALEGNNAAREHFFSQCPRVFPQ